MTGIAGPGGGTRGEARRARVLRVARAGGGRLTRSLQLPGGRLDVRDRSTTVALHLVRRLLDGTPTCARDVARLFIAVDLPAAVRAALAEFGRAAAAGDAALRAVAPTSLHVTLAFLGHRSLDEIAPLAGVVRNAAAAARRRRRSRSTRRSGSSPRRPSVLAVRLQDAVAVGWRRSRPRRPRARRRPSASSPSAERSCHTSPSRASARGIRRAGGRLGEPPATGPFHAEAVTLYRSHLGGRGPARYEPVSAVALA